MIYLQRLFSVFIFFGLSEAAFAQNLTCNDDTLLSCPGACVARCKSDEAFLGQNRQQCASVVSQHMLDPVSLDPSSCQQAETDGRETLGMCVRQARQTLRPSSGDDIVDAFLESAPTCASIPYVLTQLYDCLAGEADAISGLYGPLALRGYDTEVAPGNEGELPPVCSISRAQIDQDRLMADILTDQSEALLDEFGLVSGCSFLASLR